jgi:hypothetical protein
LVATPLVDASQPVSEAPDIAASTSPPVPFEKSRERVDLNSTVVILSFAVPPPPCTQSASKGLARGRENRGIPLVGSCEPSTRTGLSDTYGR